MEGTDALQAIVQMNYSLPRYILMLDIWSSQVWEFESLEVWRESVRKCVCKLPCFDGGMEVPKMHV